MCSSTDRLQRPCPHLFRRIGLGFAAQVARHAGIKRFQLLRRERVVGGAFQGALQGLEDALILHRADPLQQNGLAFFQLGHGFSKIGQVVVSFLPEEVAVDALDGVGALGRDTEVVVDHELGELLAVDQHDLGFVARLVHSNRARCSFRHVMVYLAKAWVMRYLLPVLFILLGHCLMAQNKPYGATWLCDGQNVIVGSILGSNLYDTQGQRKFMLRQGQSRSTRVGKYGGSPLGVSNCRQYELFDLYGNGQGCAEQTWTSFLITNYQGQTIWHTCE